MSFGTIIRDSISNWESDVSTTVYGYKTHKNACVIFVTYHKKADVSPGVAYGDEFISPEVLRYFSKNRRTLDSKDVNKIVHAKEKGIDVHIFVKKEDADGSVSHNQHLL